MKSKHNFILSNINELKEEVDLVRRERVIFDSVFKKFENELKFKEQELKKQIR